MKRSALLWICLVIPMLSFSQEGTKPAFAEALTETHVRELRLQLPNHLHVSGPSIRFPSGTIMTASVLAMIVKKEQARIQWTLEEIVVGLAHEHLHVRYAALTLLVDATKIEENYSSYLMSLEEIKSTGVLSKWQKIAAESKK